MRLMKLRLVAPHAVTSMVHPVGVQHLHDTLVVLVRPMDDGRVVHSSQAQRGRAVSWPTLLWARVLALDRRRTRARPRKAGSGHMATPCLHP
jgi:hypothetical protein